MKNNYTRNILYISLLLTTLVIIVSCVGLFTPGFYLQETRNWQAQAIGQDIFDLFLCTPVLLVSAILAYRGNTSAALILAGTIIYLIYTFLIYCFAVHFNNLFIIYCLILGLSFYSIVYFFYIQSKQPFFISIKKPTLIKMTGIYFIVISTSFYGLWLSEIIPATLKNYVPQTLIDTGLLTNPVHVIDLSVILPGIFIIGILLLKKKTSALLLAPVFLTFFILMDTTIGMLMMIMEQKGLEADLFIAAIMGGLALFSLILLWKFLSAKTDLSHQ